MRGLTFILVSCASAATAFSVASKGYMGTQYASAVEGLTQAGYKAAWTIDSKNWTALDEVMSKYTIV